MGGTLANVFSGKYSGVLQNQNAIPIHDKLSFKTSNCPLINIVIARTLDYIYALSRKIANSRAVLQIHVLGNFG